MAKISALLLGIFFLIGIVVQCSAQTVPSSIKQEISSQIDCGGTQYDDITSVRLGPGKRGYIGQCTQGARQSFDARSVFRPPAKVAQKISDCSDVGCIESVMRKAGASRQALDFNRIVKGGYMESFREMGRVDLVDYIFSPPTMYNDGGTLLINGSPQIIDVDDPRYIDNLDITRDPLYQTLNRQFPDEIHPWSGAGFERMEKLKDGGQRFIFIAQLKGCRSACEPRGYAHVAFDFDSRGNFLGAKLLRLSRSVPAPRRT